jgi:hypothetical protein
MMSATCWVKKLSPPLTVFGEGAKIYFKGVANFGSYVNTISFKVCMLVEGRDAYRNSR